MKLWTLPLLALLLAGCAGYHIGPIKPKAMEGIESIAVPSFKNDTLHPRLEVLLADGIIKQLQQDGTYRVASEETADAILEGKLLHIRRRAARSVRGDTWVTKEFVLTVTLEYKLMRRDTGASIKDATVTGQTSFFVDGDIQQNERQAIPLAIEDAAIRLVSHLSEGW